MSMLGTYRLMNALENGQLTSAQLETLLATPRHSSEFDALLARSAYYNRLLYGNTLDVTFGSATAFGKIINSIAPVWSQVLADSARMATIASDSAVMSVIVANATAMADVIASPTAMSAVAASSTAMSAVAASSTAMSAVAASSTAMSAVAGSAIARNAVVASSSAMATIGDSNIAKMAIWNSDAFCDAVAGSATAITALRAAAQYALYAGPAASDYGGNPLISNPAPAVAGKFLALRLYSSISNSQSIHVSLVRPGAVLTQTSFVNPANHLNSTVALCLPVKTEFRLSSDNSASQTITTGLLRCDV